MFSDRFDAGHQLTQKLVAYKNNPDLIILAIPRGGLQVGAVLARELNAPLDIVITKKIGYPGNSEYAIGAVGLEGEIINPLFRESLGLYIAQETKRLRQTVRQRYALYRGVQPPVSLSNKIVIITDDGIATGNTMKAACQLIRKQHPQKLTVAVPVAPSETIKELALYADEIICLFVPLDFFGISQFYRTFEQVEDSEAKALLEATKKKSWGSSNSPR